MKYLKVAGMIVNPEGSGLGTVVIDQKTGLIYDIESFSTNGTIGGKHFHIFPGLIDDHDHCREDTTGKQNYKETYLTAARAAINGGVVAIADMANKPLPPTTDEIYDGLVDLAEPAPIDIVPYAAIAPGSRPLRRFVPYKAFLAESFGDLKFISEQQARETFPYYRGKDVSEHCDDNGILAQCANKTYHEDRRPAESEIRAIRFAISTAEEFEFALLKIVHCSTREGLEEIKRAKIRGQRVLCEATPHHMYYNRNFLDKLDKDGRKRLQMNPPLREPADQKAIFEGLLNGDIDMLATDHAPYLMEEKLSEKGMSGVPHLDTYGPFCTWLMDKGFTPERIAEVASYQPGRWLSRFLSREHGKNRVGLGYGRVQRDFIGSLTVLDLNNPIVIDKQMLQTKCGWSPFEEVEFPGRVAYTIVRGKILKSPEGLQC